jgi:hypothetical protein
LFVLGLRSLDVRSAPCLCVCLRACVRLYCSRSNTVRCDLRLRARAAPVIDFRATDTAEGTRTRSARSSVCRSSYLRFYSCRSPMVSHTAWYPSRHDIEALCHDGSASTAAAQHRHTAPTVAPCTPSIAPFSLREYPSSTPRVPLEYPLVPPRSPLSHSVSTPRVPPSSTHPPARPLRSTASSSCTCSSRRTCRGCCGGCCGACPSRATK